MITLHMIDDVLIQSKILSLIPQSILDSKEIAGLRKKAKTTQHVIPAKVKVLLDWWRENVSYTHYPPDYNMAKILQNDNLLSGLSKEIYVVLFTALLRSLGFTARLVASFITIPRTFSKRNPFDDASSSSNLFPIQFFVDILDGQQQEEWITLDPITGNVDKDINIVNPTYVISLYRVDSQIIVKDTTRKFCEQWSKVVKDREEEWWEQTLWLFSPSNPTKQDKKETESLILKQVSEKMPNTMGGFLNHPLFALERHLKVNEGIYPKDKKSSVGVFKSELVYPRNLVKQLFTIENWKRKGRHIPDGTPPYKTSVSKGKQALVKDLYGEWQTVDFPRPRLDENGKIVKNQFGNIEVFNQFMIPLGCVHLHNNQLKNIAKSLDIDYAPAVVDFEHGKGRSFPVFDGIIVLEAHQEILLEALRQVRQSLDAKERAKREALVYQRWKGLIMGIVLKFRLDRDYAARK